MLDINASLPPGVPGLNASWGSLLAGNGTPGGEGEAPEGKRWGALGLLFLIATTAMGNLLVCLAVCWERRLQNMTNYFLMSLAIADFLVSILVMPLGMVVEIYGGEFPLGPELCVLWVTSDVLMCTASIWHMCTMSMDRYFTLKYPMRYGRNKTKTMVVTKILFVWVISVAISSPICVHGFVDSSIVYNHGECVPTLKTFVIYGSVFAFYIPLLIMIVTYILTIQILWKNEHYMKDIERSDRRSRCSFTPSPHFLTRVPTVMTPPSTETLQTSCQEDSLADTALLGPPKPSPLTLSPSRDVSDTEDEEEHGSLSSSRLLDKRPSSYKACASSEAELERRPSQLGPQCNPSFELDDNVRSMPRWMYQERNHHLDVPSGHAAHGGGRKGHKHSGLYPSVSDTHVSQAGSEDHDAPRGASFHLSFSSLDVDYKAAEWGRRFHQIQQEMDQCLQEGDVGQRAGSLENDGLLGQGGSAPSTLQRHEGTAASRAMEESGDSEGNEGKSTSSNNSDTVTIHLKPQSNGKAGGFRNGGTVSMSDDYESSNPSDTQNEILSPDQPEARPRLQRKIRPTKFRRGKRRFKARFRNTLRRSTKPVLQHLLAMNNASNERKASKVLGIIFLVFVVLWTPFFIVNIMTVTCSDCLTDPVIMSVFLWMGYVASLANPIIYTMFNTAFRRTFIRILTGKLRRPTSKFKDAAYVSYTTSVVQHERRNTMTVLLNNDSRIF